MVAIVETWLNSKTSSEVLLGEVCSTYEVFRCDRSRKKGGGVAILVKSDLNPSLVYYESVTEGYEIACCDIIAKPSSYRLIVVYRSPRCSAQKSDQLFKCISDITTCRHPCVLMGDFNFPGIKWSGTPLPYCAQSKQFLDMLANHYYRNFVHNHTR